MMLKIFLYIDPGSAMIIVQLLISLFAGVVIFLKNISNYKKYFFQNL